MELDQKTIEDILDALFRMERLLQKSDRANLLSVIDLLEAINFKAFREAVENMHHTELDMRMARLRIQAATGLQPPALMSEKDNTPVEPLLARRRSSATMPAAERRESATMPSVERPEIFPGKNPKK